MDCQMEIGPKEFLGVNLGEDQTQEKLGEKFEEKVVEFVKSFPLHGPSLFNEKFYKSRREMFLSKLPPNSATIVVGNNEVSRNSDVDFQFRQISNFSHLTGFEEPDSVAIVANPGEDSDWKARFTLIVRPKDPLKETWTGYRAGPKGAVETYEADEAYTNEDLVKTLIKVCEAVDKIFVIPNDQNKELNDKVLITLRAFHKDFSIKECDKSPDLHEIRMFKSPYEVALLQQAVKISHEGHVSAMKQCKLTLEMMQANKGFALGRNECEIQAVIEKEFKMRGGARVGYPSIVASGKNATILHHVKNDSYTKPGDLVLIDAGVEYGGYTADITRTWPLNGKFSSSQRAVYECVLKAQNMVIEAAQPGKSILDLHGISVKVLAEGMVAMGILKGDVEKLIEEEAYKKYYMHTIGHFLGRDVHDVHIAQSWPEGKKIPLKPGMVITVEPGIYIPFDDETVPPEYRGIGVRIEDNILITESKPYNLSHMIPREIAEIEKIMKS